MPKTLIVYGSTTGNTERVAMEIGKIMHSSGVSARIVSAAEVQAEGLADGYETLLFGCSTWGDDDIELQDDFVPLFENMERMHLAGKGVAVFGCGDSACTWFCGAVDVVEKRAELLGATVLTDALRIDGRPALIDIENWTADVIDTL